jgi:hypothetical protein
MYAQLLFHNKEVDKLKRLVEAYKFLNPGVKIMGEDEKAK